MKTLTADPAVWLVIILVISLIWNPPAIHFEPEPVYIELQ